MMRRVMMPALAEDTVIVKALAPAAAAASWNCFFDILLLCSIF